MRTKTAQWFETVVKYDAMQEDGMLKPINQINAVEAMSFTEAEAKISEEVVCYANGEYAIKKIAIAPYREVVFSNDPSHDRWYRVKVSFITIDERSEKEKRQNVTYLIQAKSVETARMQTDRLLSDGMQDYSIVSITETNIEDVYEK